MNRKPGRYSVALLGFVRNRTYGKRPRYRFPPLPAHLLCYVTQGSGQLLIEDRLHELQTHRFYFVAAGSAAEVSLRSERIGLCVAAFRHLAAPAGGCGGDWTEADRSPVAGAPLFPSGQLKVNMPDRLAIRLRLLEEACRASEDWTRVQLQFQELLHLVVSEADANEPARRGQAAPSGIGKAVEYMRTHYHGRLDMGTLSAMANLTPSSFSRLFKKKYGESPNEYLTGLRIDNAKRMLSNDECKVKAVSEAVGYDDEFHFSRVFHRTVGVSPTMYMKRKRLKVATASCLPIDEGLQSLDVTPVATVNLFRYPGTDEREYEAALTAQRDELRRTKPDLILCDFYHGKFDALLRSLSPAIKRVSERSWAAYYRQLAEMLGRSAEAERVIAQLALQATAAGRQLKTALGRQSVLLVQIGDHDIRIQGAAGHPLGELLYAELGLQPGRNVPSQARRLEVLPERIPQVDADCVLVFQNHIRGNSGDVYDRLRRTEVWRSIKAVRHGNVVTIPNWFKMSWSPEGRTAIVRELLSLQGIGPER